MGQASIIILNVTEVQLLTLVRMINWPITDLVLAMVLLALPW
jgi:hypothetical protein